MTKDSRMEEGRDIERGYPKDLADVLGCWKKLPSATCTCSIAFPRGRGMVTGSSGDRGEEAPLRM